MPMPLGFGEVAELPRPRPSLDALIGRALIDAAVIFAALSIFLLILAAAHG